MLFFIDKLYTSQNVRQSAIYNACILFCDCLKITKQITQTTRVQVQASYNDCYHKIKQKNKTKTEPFSYLKARETKNNNNNMILGRQLNFCICHCLKILLHFYVCFFSVQHFAAKKQGVQASLKSNINNIQ